MSCAMALLIKSNYPGSYTCHTFSISRFYRVSCILQYARHADRLVYLIISWRSSLGRSPNYRRMFPRCDGSTKLATSDFFPHQGRCMKSFVVSVRARFRPNRVRPRRSPSSTPTTLVLLLFPRPSLCHHGKSPFSYHAPLSSTVKVPNYPPVTYPVSRSSISIAPQSDQLNHNCLLDLDVWFPAALLCSYKL